jgi:transcriptional regulator with XRE-family HTH domain
MQNNQNLGNYLRALRKERDLTLHQVAIGVDVDSPLLSKLERSERLPTAEQVKRLSAFFNLNENELLAKTAAERIIKEYGLGEVTQQAVKMVQEQLVEYSSKKH